jgi:hypothetical protein
MTLRIRGQRRSDGFWLRHYVGCAGISLRRNKPLRGVLSAPGAGL